MTKTSKSSPASRAPLSRELILRTALELADESGIASLSMRKLGQALGVEAMSLYNHVKNKEDLLDGVVDLVVAEFVAPRASTHWQDAMRERANSARDALRRHPWSAPLLLSRVNVGPAMLHYVNATIGCLLEAGFSYELADRAWNAIDSHVYGFTLQEINFPFAPSEYAEVAEDFMAQIPAGLYPHLGGLAQEVIEGRHDGVQDFEFGLKLILDGLQGLLEG